jgi:hypothetical protein
MDPDADPDPAIIASDLKDANKQQIFLKKFFYLLPFEGTLLPFSKIKSQKKVTKHKESKFFLLFLLGGRRIRIRINTSD